MGLRGKRALRSGGGSEFCTGLNIGASITTNTCLGVPCYNCIMGSNSLSFELWTVGLQGSNPEEIFEVAGFFGLFSGCRTCSLAFCWGFGL